MINKNVDKEIAAQLTELILSMHKDKEGQQALAKVGYQKFDPADSNSYQPVKDFLKEYNAALGVYKR